eukprot:scaffold137931_cov36-Tisochrysis_lutea.AAC.4
MAVPLRSSDNNTHRQVRATQRAAVVRRPHASIGCVEGDDIGDEGLRKGSRGGISGEPERKPPTMSRVVGEL